MKIKKALIIGPSGIGKVHIRELLKNKINKIAVLGKKYKKNRNTELNIFNSKSLKFLNFKNFNQVKKFNPDITCICSPFFLHLDHINKCEKYSKKIIIEKPFFWLKSKNVKNIEFITKNLLKKLKNKARVNLPMTSLASQLINKKEIPIRIKNFNFKYYTKGKKIFNDIPIDLLPHAISFFMTIDRQRIKNFKIINVKKSKFKWISKIIINDVVCNFLFSQNKKKKESFLSFDINNSSYIRKQTVVNKEYVSSIKKNNKKIIKIKNPMSESISAIVNNSDRHFRAVSNHAMVNEITKLTNNLINWKKVSK